MTEESNVVWRTDHRIWYWPAENPPIADQIIVGDGGLLVSHNVVCAVCEKRKAVLDLNYDVFLPCDFCYDLGWNLVEQNKGEVIDVVVVEE